jgi:hypothetical protein
VKPLFEFSIVRQLAEHVARHMTERTIAELQDMTETLGSGDDSGMENLWEESCVQVQYDEFPLWDAFRNFIRAAGRFTNESRPNHDIEKLRGCLEELCWPAGALTASRNHDTKTTLRLALAASYPLTPPPYVQDC